jgi:hypothetical protein
LGEIADINASYFAEGPQAVAEVHNESMTFLAATNAAFRADCIASIFHGWRA